jgi:hypothetical protein
MREILLRKYDLISAHTLEYIEKHTIYTPEEMEKLKAQLSSHKKIDSNTKNEFHLIEGARDVKFGIWGNVQGKSFHHKKTEFGGLSCGIPRTQSNNQIIMRVIWTSFDYLTGFKYYPQIAVVISLFIN